jgi:hypothetical protein
LVPIAGFFEIDGDSAGRQLPLSMFFVLFTREVWRSRRERRDFTAELQRVSVRAMQLAIDIL